MSECRCDFRGKILGDGCDVCNPAKALEYALETIADQAAELDSLRSQLAAADARANECGSGAGCLYKDALLATAEARAERLARLLLDVDNVATDRFSEYGACDCVDTYGTAYQSQTLDDELRAIRAALAEEEVKP